MPRPNRDALRCRSTPTEPPVAPEVPSNVATRSEPVPEPLPQDEPTFLMMLTNVMSETHALLRENLINENGEITKARLKVNDMYVLLGGKKIVLERNELGQPVRESGGLLEQFLGHVASEFSNFPISYTKWSKIPDKFHVSDESHKKYIMGSLGKKWRDNRSRLFTKCYDPTLSWEANLQKHPTYIPVEQWAAFLQYRMEKKTQEELQTQSQLSSEDDAYTTVFGKEHPKHVQTVGQGVCPSQMFGSTSRAGESSSSNYILKVEYDANMEMMKKKVEENDTEIKSLKSALAYMMQHMGGSLPSGFPNINQVNFDCYLVILNA
ncbi:hypothetical protein CDL12_15287 [Handroanthus impetiginosus]|uniref:Uncharacterized protein n=1 Tax=Handroanthus impetiginosus TaxID=429701 RepID=A0A2G9H3K9_9LAMI|nr:hypothetical protein CDL12_15287 [Handroanthus impetiginosus]